MAADGMKLEESAASSDGFIRVTALSELKEGKGKVFILGDDEIAVIKLTEAFTSIDGTSGQLNSRLYAFVNVCPHQHTPLVDSCGGQVSGQNLTCPMHGWTYDLKTGGCINGNGKLKMLEIRVQDGGVFVKKRKSNGTCWR